MGPSEGSKYLKPARDRWVWWSLVPFGFGAWTPIVPGVRYRSWRWTGLGLFWIAFMFVAILLAAGGTAALKIASYMFLLAWLGGVATAFTVRTQLRNRRWFIAGRGRAPATLTTGTTYPYPSVPYPAAGVPYPVPATPYPMAPYPMTPYPAMPYPVKLRREGWPWVAAIPLGFGSWAPIIAAIRCRVWWWAVPGVICFGGAVAGLFLASSAQPVVGRRSTESEIGSLMMWTAWIIGVIVSFAIRPAYERRRGRPLPPKPAWPRPTAASAQWTLRYALLAYIVSFLAVIALGIVLIDVLDVSISIGVNVLLVDAILLAGLVPLARKRGLALADLGIRPTIALRSLGLVVLALISYLVIAAIWEVVFISHSTQHAASDLSQSGHLSTVATVLAVIAIAFSAPIVEEIFFRGFIYRSLRNRLPVAAAALIAGCLFGLVHILGYPLITLPIKAAFGVIACLLYERTGSLLPGIALHSFVDATAIDVALTGNDFIVLSVAALLAFVILIRAAVLKLRRRTLVPSML